MAAYNYRTYLPSDEALPVVGRAASLFAEKVGVPFRFPANQGDFMLVLFRDEEPMLVLSFEPLSCVNPIFNPIAINGTSAFAMIQMDESDHEFVNETLDRIQSLQNGRRCSIVLSSTRRGWLKWSRTYGFYYIGRHSETDMFCFERA